MNTVFPYGLNMDIKHKGIKNAYNHVIGNKSQVTIYSTFNVVNKTDRVRKGSKTSNNVPNSDNFNADTWIRNTLGIATAAEVINKVREEIFKLKTRDIKILFIYIIRKLNMRHILTFTMSSSSNFKRYITRHLRISSLFAMLTS